MPTRRLATLDVGSNTVLLLVADVAEDGTITPVLDHAEITRLGEKAFEDHELKQEPMARTIGVLSDLKQRVEALDARLVDAVATSAVREATNSNSFLLMAKAVGVPLRVLPGDDEATLSFLSVAMEPPVVKSDELVVIDIGGGSTEIVTGTLEGLAARASIPLGAVRLTESLVQRHPVSREVLGEMRGAARLQLKNAPRPTGDFAFVGVAGTVTTLAAIHHEIPIFDVQRTHNLSLAMSDVESLLDRLARLSLDDRRALTGLDPKRADVIVAGTAILLEAMAHTGADTCWVSDRGVRWGLLRRAIANA